MQIESKSFLNLELKQKIKNGLNNKPMLQKNKYIRLAAITRTRLMRPRKPQRVLVLPPDREPADFPVAMLRSWRIWRQRVAIEVVPVVVLVVVRHNRGNGHGGFWYSGMWNWQRRSMPRWIALPSLDWRWIGISKSLCLHWKSEFSMELLQCGGCRSRGR